MASTSQATNHRIYCAVTGTLPPATMSGLPGEDAVKNIAQRAIRNDESSRQSSSLHSWPGTGCMLSLNLYVIYLLFRADDDVDVEYITVLLILLFHLHFVAIKG